MSPNKLLAALPPGEYRRIAPHLTRVTFRQREVLLASGERIRRVHFVTDGVCSRVATMEDGRTVEVACVGREGMTGVAAVFGGRFAMADVVAYLPGATADMLSIDAFAAEMRRRGPLYDVACAYTDVLIGVLMQSAACNGLHAADLRTARWLLQTHDRLGRDMFPLTQETLAVLLGVRRATVTAVIGEFERAGLVEFGRRRVTIRDRGGLEGMACECYRVISGYFGRLS